MTEWKKRERVKGMYATSVVAYVFSSVTQGQRLVYLFEFEVSRVYKGRVTESSSLHRQILSQEWGSVGLGVRSLLFFLFSLELYLSYRAWTQYQKKAKPSPSHTSTSSAYKRSSDSFFFFHKIRRKWCLKELKNASMWGKAFPSTLSTK